MSNVPVVSVTSKVTGNSYDFIDEVKASGGMKDIYFAPSKDYVIGFFRDQQGRQQEDRIKEIVTRYRDNLYNQAGGHYWDERYRWPFDMVEHNGRLGVVTPFFEKEFFFSHGAKRNDFLKIKGKEKEGKWFASASNRASFLDERELGNYLTHLQICLQIARSVRRMHSAGLAHSDLSYKNILVDPTSGKACIIDIDGLVVPGKFAPDVVGTPDFIAPEVMATQGLEKTDPNRALPNNKTDRHALAVLIYMYLFYRHPLRGRKVHAQDPALDEELGMGKEALWIEHPKDASNRVRVDDVKPAALPWADPAARPYTMAGPYLAELFEKAFIDGLHEPNKRPSAAVWETALVKTIDLIQPCSAKCDQQWFVFDGKTKPVCPHCGAPYQGKLPILNLYSSRRGDEFRPDNHRLMVWDGQSLFKWHVQNNISPNEHLKPEDMKRVGYFRRYSGNWWLVNETGEGMKDVTDGLANARDIGKGDKVKLVDGVKILLSSGEHRRLAVIQLAGS